MIALGRNGLKLASGLERDIGIVAGGVLSVPEAEARNIPVFSLAPHWICKTAADDRLERIELATSYAWPREQAFERLAWAQWTVDEIASGAPFDHLLHHARQGQVRAAV